jgi:hypothetical protein
MSLFVTVPVRMLVPVVVREVNIELRPFNLKSFGAARVEMIAVQMQLLQFVLEVMEINAEIEHRANKHIAADAAEDVEVKSFHGQYTAQVLLGFFRPTNNPATITMIETSPHIVGNRQAPEANSSASLTL